MEELERMDLLGASSYVGKKEASKTSEQREARV